MKRILFLLLVFFSAGNSYASHISGGELTYEYIGPGTKPNSDKYKITMRLYRECSSVGAQLNNEVVNIGIYDAVSNGYLDHIQLLAEWNTNSAPPEIHNNPNNIPCLTGDKDVCFQVGVFSNTKDITRSANGYILAWTRFSRQQLTNVDDEPYPAAATGATFITHIPGTNLLGAGGVNSSPQFKTGDTALVCAGKQFFLDYGATDKDGDSLSYSFCPAYDGGNDTDPNPDPQTINPLRLYQLPYIVPYSGYTPLGNLASINTSTGLISGKAPSVAGKYAVNVCVTEWRNGLPLNIHRKDFILKVGDCSLTDAELKPSYLTCDGFTLSFENNSPSDNINSYYWEFGDPNSTTDTSIEPTPNYTYPDSGVYVVKLVVNRGEKCSDSTYTRALVYPGFIPGFEVKQSCFLNPYEFVDMTTTKYGVVDSWRWNFGEPTVTSDTSVQQNPSYKYPAPETVDVKLIVTNSKGCTDTLIQSIVIPDKPTLILPFHDTLICVIDSLQLQASTLSGNGNYTWLPSTNITRSDVSNPIVFPKQTTTYAVTVNDQGCINSDSVTVNVINKVELNIGSDTSICKTDTLQFHPVTNAIYFAWSSPSETLSDPSIPDPFSIPLNAAKYQLTASVGKCNATDQINVNVVPYPQANAGDDTSICFGKTTVLRSSIVGSRFTWSPGNTLLNENTLTPTAGPQYTTAYILTVTDQLGCPKPKTDTVTVVVVPRVLAFAGHDTTIVATQPLQLNASGGSFYTWSPTTGMDNPNIANPIVTLGTEFDTITYRVNVSTEEGCSAQDDIVVHVFKTKPEIFIPTAFTPNADGLNDLLTPKLAGMKQFSYFKVFNRLGVMLYSTSQEGQGWDGTYAGRAQASGTYVFVASAVDYLGKVITKKGTVVLIR